MRKTRRGSEGVREQDDIGGGLDRLPLNVEIYEPSSSLSKILSLRGSGNRRAKMMVPALGFGLGFIVCSSNAPTLLSELEARFLDFGTCLLLCYQEPVLAHHQGPPSKDASVESPSVA